MTLLEAPFRPGWALTAQAGTALAIVLALAGWQLSRALEKGALADARVERLRAPPIEAADFSAATPDFTRVSLTGAYDPASHFLVADRRGRGHQVYTPLRAPEGVFLVNRGWLVPPSGAATLPRVRTPHAQVAVVGVVWPLTPVPRIVAGEEWPEGWPKRIGGLDTARMAATVGAHPKEIRLVRGGTGVFRAATLSWDYATGMHWGYVAQWLAIGAAVAGGYVFMGKRRGLRLAIEKARDAS